MSCDSLAVERLLDAREKLGEADIIPSLQMS